MAAGAGAERGVGPRWGKATLPALCCETARHSKLDERPPILSLPLMFFPRLLQKAIWMFCAEAHLGICNGNRIDDRDRCTQTGCPLFVSCERVPLRRQLAEI